MRAPIAFATLLIVISCSQRVTPEEEYAGRERERPLLATEGRVGAGSATGGTVAAETSDPEAIAVTVEWLGSADRTVASTDVLFLFVRPPGVTSGPPLAVRRIPSPAFPLSVQIGPRDAMIAGTQFPERVAVSARLDRDGVATTTGPDDWSATSEPVAPGGEARIVLEREGAR